MAEKRPPDVYTLMVEVGRAEDDGLPAGCDGAAILCFSAGRTEREAVDGAVAVLREAGMAPLSVESHGTIRDRERTGPLTEDDHALAARALAEDAVIVLQVVPFEDEEGTGDEDDGDGSGNGPGGGAGSPALAGGRGPSRR